MQARANIHEVIQAGRVLFGPEFLPDRGWQGDLKRVYRRRAMESHPDRAVQLGRDVTELEGEFRAVTDAYRVLVEMLSAPLAPLAGGVRAGWTPPPPARPWRPEARDPVLPRRRLRFAEFLYHLGRVPWQALVDAVVWQRAQRPAVGRIAVDFGFLRPVDVSDLLRHRAVVRRSLVPFAQFAVGEGLMTDFERMAVLGRQRRLQQPIGLYFVELGLIEDAEIDELRRRMALHNAHVR